MAVPVASIMVVVSCIAGRRRNNTKSSSRPSSIEWSSKANLSRTVFLLTLFPNVAAHAFSAPEKHNIKVNPVTTQADLVALADLRYDEWIAGKNDEKSNQSPPSRYAFRMATAEIVAERSEIGARVLLARINDDDRSNIDDVVGAAEISPIEFNGAIHEGDSSPQMLYVTDVVTSAKRRRMGIASSLMDAVEVCACDMCDDGKDVLLFLHVKQDNDAAQSFYSNPKIGYNVPTSEQMRGVSINQLEKNAGTAGQILLCKTIHCNQGTAGVTTGFGGTKGKVSRGEKKKKKTKWKKR